MVDVGTWVPVGDVVSLEPNEVSVAVKTVAADIAKAFSPVVASPGAEEVPGKALELNGGDDESESDTDSDS